MFHYQDKVRVVSGFYEGVEGVLESEDKYMHTMLEGDSEETVSYTLRLAKDKFITVSEENLEPVENDD